MTLPGLSLPILSETARDLSQKPRREIGDSDPGENKKAVVVDDQVEMVLGGVIIPTNETITTRHTAAEKPMAEASDPPRRSHI